MRYFLIVVLLSFSSLSQAFISNQHDFLPVEEAFRFELMDDVEPAVLVWQIAPEHYLYRDKLGITDAKGNSNSLSPEYLVPSLPETANHSFS